ncbi:helix-turn-helix transcriptional regulator [Nocardiopsis eucommiae]|uniref:Helix-turn-helix transcriptional regulator n=1 Tax=Nocardiopsis eucommiae TaxID=2831970 RepID=A0A975LCD4_9ACTN|nr:helix-turn-helix transcriptional regulator [Nocardiopsis eucommiae]
MTEKPTPTPEGELIQSAIKRAKLSARQAAERAGISEGRWRQIANGYQVVAKGTYIPVTGPAETVAAMAEVAGVTAVQLAEVGREDAAEELRAKRGSEGSVPAPAGTWDGEIVGPDGPLFEGETLRWRDEEELGSLSCRRAA